MSSNTLAKNRGQDAQSDSRPTVIVAPATLAPGVLQRQGPVWSRGNAGLGQGSLPNRGRGSSTTRGRGTLMGRRGVHPRTGRVFQLKGLDVGRAWGSAFGALRGRRPTGQRAQGCKPAASSNNKFTPLAGSCDSENPGSDSPGGPGSDAHHTGSKSPQRTWVVARHWKSRFIWWC